MHAINSHCKCFRVNLNHWSVAVANHVCLADSAAVFNSNNLLLQTITLFNTIIERGFGHEGCASLTICTTQCAERTTVHQRLASWQRSVGVTHNGVVDYAAFDNHLWLGTEELRSPQNQVSHFACFNRANHMSNTVRDGRVDSDFCNITQYAEVVVVSCIFWQFAACFFHEVCSLHATLPVLTDTAHGLGVRREYGDCAQIVQHVFSSNGFRTNTAFSESSVSRNCSVQVVANADHVEQLGLGVDTERQAGVGRRRQHVHEASCTDDVRSVTTATAFSVEGVDGTTFKRSNGVFHIAGLVQSVGVDGNLHVVLVGYAQASADRVRCCTPVFVNLEASNTSFNLTNQSSLTSSLTCSSLTFAQETNVHRHCIRSAHHFFNVESARCNCSCVGAVCRTEATTEQGSNTTSQASVIELITDEVNVGINTTSCQDRAAAVDNVSSWTADQTRCNTSHYVGVTGFTQTNDFAVTNTNVCLNNALHSVDNSYVADQQIKHAACTRCSVVKAHAITHSFTTTEHCFVTVGVAAQVFFNFNKQVGVAQTDFVTNCRAVQTYILFTRYLSHNAFLSIIENASL